MNLTGMGFVFLLGACLALSVSCGGDAEDPGQPSPTAPLAQQSQVVGATERAALACPTVLATACPTVTPPAALVQAECPECPPPVVSDCPQCPALPECPDVQPCPECPPQSQCPSPSAPSRADCEQLYPPAPTPAWTPPASDPVLDGCNESIQRCLGSEPLDVCLAEAAAECGGVQLAVCRLAPELTCYLLGPVPKTEVVPPSLATCRSLYPCPSSGCPDCPIPSPSECRTLYPCTWCPPECAFCMP